MLWNEEFHFNGSLRSVDTESIPDLVGIYFLVFFTPNRRFSEEPEPFFTVLSDSGLSWFLVVGDIRNRTRIEKGLHSCCNGQRKGWLPNFFCLDFRLNSQTQNLPVLSCFPAHVWWIRLASLCSSKIFSQCFWIYKTPTEKDVSHDRLDTEDNVGIIKLNSGCTQLNEHNFLYSKKKKKKN